MTFEEALTQARAEFESQVQSRAKEVLTSQLDGLQVELDGLTSSRDSRVAAIDQEINDKRNSLAELRASLESSPEVIPG